MRSRPRPVPGIRESARFFLLAAITALAGCAAPGIEVDVEVVILGIAQDGGVPQIGDACDNCKAAREDPRRRHRVAALGLVDRTGGRAYLIDATPDFPEQWDALLEETGRAADGARTAPDGIFLTHAHMGHYLGLAHLGREAFGAKGVPVHATEAMHRFLSGNAPWELLLRLGNISPVEVRPGVPVVLRDGLTVTPIHAPHRHEYSDAVAYLIEARRRLLYCPDTDGWEGWQPSIEDLCRDVDYALLDGTFYSADELPGRDLDEIPHPLVTESMERLSKVARERPGRVLFLHLNHSNPLLRPEGEERKRLEAAGFLVAEEGMKLPL